MPRVLLASLAAALPHVASSQSLEAQAGILYYVSVPLGAVRAERTPTLGFAVQGRVAERAVQVRVPVMRLDGEGSVDAKSMLVGAAALGFVLLAGGKDRSADSQRARQADAPAPAPGSPCRSTPSC
jgi:hypothetical protein